MATPNEAKDAKQTFDLTVKYKSPVSGEWLTTTATKKLFEPDKIATVAVNYTDNEGKSQSRDCEFESIDIPDVESALALFQTNPLFALSSMRYGADLYARNIAKAPQSTELEGPGKLLKKQAEQFMATRAKMGKPITLDRAMEIVKQMMDLGE